LSEKGIAEAKAAGEVLKDFKIDRVFTSVLKRAIDTTSLALESASQTSVTVVQNAALNERHYGDLQGLNKDEMRQKYGAEQVHIWRRSYDVKPPGGESLKDTCNRVLPYYRDVILPFLVAGETVLVSAHGNSLRCLIKELDGLSDIEVVNVEVPTGKPIIYQGVDS
jgi:2,3-bisphosphoglycerate-dependent phosphoglycerate mutase